jgi:putative IMPACT (imprinted ancient) family translation regulator
MSDTLAAPASHAIEVKHSRFLAQAAPVQTSAQALAFLEEIARTPATHHCWAWRIGGDYRSSDDGEPAGTAGRPILAAIDGQGFDRVMVVVTRWYGGVKLGAGGLVRAYGGAAAECLRAAPRQALVDWREFDILAGFDDTGARARRACGARGAAPVRSLRCGRLAPAGAPARRPRGRAGGPIARRHAQSRAHRGQWLMADASADIEKTAQSKGKVVSLRGLWPFVHRQRGLFAAWLLALCASSAATLALPVAVRGMIDDGFHSASNIDATFALLFGVTAALALATAARFYFVSLLGERVVADLRQRLYSHLLGLDPAFFEATRSGELVSRLSADTELLRSLVGSSISVALRSLIMVLGSIAMMFVTSPRLATYTMVGIPLFVAPIVIGSRRLQKMSRQSQDRVADANALANEVLGNVRTVQSHAREPVRARPLRRRRRARRGHRAPPHRHAGDRHRGRDHRVLRRDHHRAVVGRARRRWPGA